MSFGAVALLGLALSAPSARPAPASPAACTKYSVFAEKNDLAADQDVAGWATAALEKADVLDKASPCFVHVRITAGPIRKGGKEDGWMAHVSTSTRRLQKDGKLVTREKGTLFVEPLREGLVEKVRKFVGDYASSLGSTAPPGTDRG
jgi:creatinine amidohydrolase/Fe(II)-dependent formamide hydrolase-like protein